MTLLKHFFSRSHSLTLILTLFLYTFIRCHLPAPHNSHQMIFFSTIHAQTECERERQIFPRQAAAQEEGKSFLFFIIFFLDEREREFFTCEITIFSLLWNPSWFPLFLLSLSLPLSYKHGSRHYLFRHTECVIIISHMINEIRKFACFGESSWEMWNDLDDEVFKIFSSLLIY